MLDTSPRGLRPLGYVSSIKPPSSVYNSYLFLSGDIHQGDDHFSVQIYRVRVYKKVDNF